MLLSFSSIYAYAEEENILITRAELANEVMSTYEYITQEFSLPMAERPVFSDISQSPFKFRIFQAYVNGFMNGVGDGQFSPDTNITRCESAVVFYRLMQSLNKKYNLIQEEKDVYISDFEIIPDWGREAVTFMVSTNLMSIVENKFCPDSLAGKKDIEEITYKIKDMFDISADEERIDFNTFLERINKKFNIYLD